jgi:hypothetical protein
LPVLHFSDVSGPLKSLIPVLLSIGNWVPVKPVLEGVKDIARIHYPSHTDFFKPSMQFSYNRVVINASKESLFQDFYTSQQQVSSAV